MNQNLPTKQLTEKVFDLLSKHKDKQKFIEDCSETFSGNELIQFADLLEKLEKNKNKSNVEPVLHFFDIEPSKNFFLDLINMKRTISKTEMSEKFVQILFDNYDEVKLKSKNFKFFQKKKKDGTGTIDEKELEKIIFYLSNSFKPMISEIIQSGKIEINRYSKINSESKMIENLKEYDEKMKPLEKLIDNISINEDEILKHFQKLDLDKNELIDFLEFKKYFTKILNDRTILIDETLEIHEIIVKDLIDKLLINSDEKKHRRRIRKK